MSPAGTAGPAGLRPVFAARPKFTSRAAVLAIVLCAIALTLAYPVREYIAERRQIDQLEAQRAQISAEVRQLKAEQRALNTSSYIEQQARDRLHMCFPTQTCYEVINPAKAQATLAAAPASSPWYARLWQSVRAADRPPARAPARVTSR